MNLITLDAWDLLLAALLIGLNAFFSIWLRLSLERQLLIAALRMIVQLTLMGFVLKTLFAISSLPFTLTALTFMALFAGNEVHGRQERRFTGWWSYGVGTISGNTMTGISLGLNTLTAQVARERISVEAQLALGATFLQAIRPLLRGAAKTGFIPIVNSMAAVGLVSLPGMMTGQILSGVDPIEAIKYQMLIMFLITGGTGLGVMIAVHAGAWRLTDRRHRLRLDRLAAESKAGKG